MPASMAKIPGPKLLSHTPMRLEKTQRWLEATTFDGSKVQACFRTCVRTCLCAAPVQLYSMHGNMQSHNKQCM